MKIKLFVLIILAFIQTPNLAPLKLSGLANAKLPVGPEEQWSTVWSTVWTTVYTLIVVSTP